MVSCILEDELPSLCNPVLSKIHASEINGKMWYYALRVEEKTLNRKLPFLPPGLYATVAIRCIYTFVTHAGICYCSYLNSFSLRDLNK